MVEDILEDKIKEIERYRKQVNEMQMDIVKAKADNKTQLSQTFNAEGYANQTLKENHDLKKHISSLQNQITVLEKSAGSNRDLKN